jgi:lipopolysaccharide/colanic/teichoic acid biosynthesis glycosyltransferase
MWVLFSPKYFKTLIVVGHSSKVSGLLELIKAKNFHKVAVYASDASIEHFEGFNDVTTTKLSKLIEANISVTEIVISKDGFSKEIVKSLNKQLIQLFGEGINIKSFEKYYEEVTDRVPKEYLDTDFYKNINYSKSSENRLYLFTRRILDVFISVAGLTVFLLFVPCIFIANLIGNKGPLFYNQNRVGKNGKIFKILKLRSMKINAEKSGAVWAVKNDKRITTFGKFLRNTRLDEMPQFFNILKGEMSLIGPRPERPEFANELGKDIPFYAIRQVIKPGLTGWAQVSYPYAGTIEEQEMKLRYDLFYIKERSSFLDFKIFIKTITTVLFFRGQ